MDLRNQFIINFRIKPYKISKNLKIVKSRTMEASIVTIKSISSGINYKKYMKMNK